MKYQEKKYRIDSLDQTKKKLEELGAKKETEVISTHYYGKQESNDVIKLVEYSDRNEIHKLEESQGKYYLKEKVTMPDTKTGLRWLKDQGYKTVDLVKMVYTDYEYEGGIVGLYTINDFLHSVILDFPFEQQEAMEKSLGLDHSEVIGIPYNKYLEKIGKLQSIKLN